VGQGQDPYDDAGRFTPYQPDATPDGEPPEVPPAAPFVPYGNAPYGGTPYGTGIGAPLLTSAPSGNRWWPWGVAIAVVVATFGSCFSGLFGVIGAIGGSDSDAGVPPAVRPEIPEIYANDLAEGQCVNGAGLKPGTTEPVSGLEVVDCSTAHDAEVLAVKVLDAEAAAGYDFDDDSQIDVNCRDRFSERQKETLREGDYFVWALTETAQPATNDKVVCLVVHGDGSPLRGTFAMGG